MGSVRSIRGEAYCLLLKQKREEEEILLKRPLDVAFAMHEAVSLYDVAQTTRLLGTEL